MLSASYKFDYEVYASIDELNAADKALLLAAREVTKNAYAPYSQFQVGAAAILNNGQIMTGTNQENASYPAGICAERVLLSAIAAVHVNEPVKAIAISYHNIKGESKKPIFPCGICRQSLVEYETRTQQTMRIILSGQEGEVYIIAQSSYMLPFGFSGSDMG